MRCSGAAALLLLAGPRELAASCPEAPVVVAARQGFAASTAGLRPGDVLCGWERAASPPANPEPARGALTSVFDIEAVEMEEAPRGEITLTGHRQAEPLAVRMPPGEWRLAARPPLDDAPLANYEQALTLADRGEHERALGVWAEAARAVERAGSARRASELWYGLGVAASALQRREEADSALGRAATLVEGTALALVHAAAARSFNERSDWDRAEEGFRRALGVHQARSEALGEARMLRELGVVASNRGNLDAAEALWRRSLALRDRHAPESLEVAASVNGLGWAAHSRGDLESAETYYRRALAIRERLVPGGLEVAASLNNVGSIVGQKGDLAAAEGYIERALAIEETRAPSYQLTYSLNNLAHIAFTRGDLASAAERMTRVLAIREALGVESRDVADALHNLGSVAAARGDLRAADHYFRRGMDIYARVAPEDAAQMAMIRSSLGEVAAARGDRLAAREHYEAALALGETVAPRALETAVTIASLGELAEAERDLDAAERLHRRALQIREEVASGSEAVARSLHHLGEVARRRGDLPSARRHLEAALAILERVAPRGPTAGHVLYALGEVALAGSELASATALFRRVLEIRRDLAPGSADEAAACERLATLARRQGRSEEALALYRHALDALDAQRQRLGGSDDAKTRFAAQQAGHYRSLIDLLMDAGQPGDAFHVLERYRARALLAMLAERDLVFSADVPPSLDRERRMLDIEYDRALAALSAAKPADTTSKREELLRIRSRQGEVQDRIRAASPRLAALQHPLPLDAAATRTSLDPGTLLLSYSIGDDHGYVFAVGPGAEGLGAARLEVDANTLRAEVGRFRELLQERAILKRRQLDQLGTRLGQVLLGPFAARLRDAQRVMVLPDGPLHLLPFAALGDPRAEGRYFVESLPVHVAASATVFAEIRKARRPTAAGRLVAFGDPDYSAAAPGAPASAAAELRSATLRWLELRPLPSARREVDDLRSLFPETSRIYVGRDATEDRAKADGRDATILHFACHGLADEDSPLDSSLALSMPADWKPGQPNGLLQAWEIFEQVRLDADLVTLSACGTALGKEMSGEGILGLTRAFQYAGARSVLASLWAVRDDSTADLMGRFYRHLRDGKTKDAALRAAQIEMIRRGHSSSHPGRWAAFQLIGDWR